MFKLKSALAVIAWDATHCAAADQSVQVNALQQKAAILKQAEKDRYVEIVAWLGSTLVIGRKKKVLRHRLLSVSIHCKEVRFSSQQIEEAYKTIITITNYFENVFS